MVTFFFWFGIICFTLIIGVLIISGIIKDWFVGLYRYLLKKYLIRNDPPRFKVNEIVECRGYKYSVYDRNYEDMNNNYEFKWLYMLHIIEKDYKSNWDNDRSRVYTYSDNINKM